jgi:hypothetical protein
MELTFLGTTSDKVNCPNLYETDHDTYVVQGDKVTDHYTLAQLRARGFSNDPELGAAVEIPKALLDFAPERVGMISADDSHNLFDTGRGTYIVCGAPIVDATALATLHARGLPDHETVVEVSKVVLRFTPELVG